MVKRIEDYTDKTIKRDTISKMFNSKDVRVLLNMEPKQSMTAVGKDGKTYNIYVAKQGKHPYHGYDQNTHYTLWSEKV